MAEPEQTTSEPTSPFWARVKIVMGFAPAIVALGTAITAIVKVYDQSSQKAVYETLGKKVEENASALQDTHSDVKAVWAYLNGMAAGKAEASANEAPPPPPVATTPVKPKVSTFWTKPKKSETTSVSPNVDLDGVAEVEPQARINVAQESPRKALPDISPSPKSERLPSFEDVIERPKAR